jgi:hypothetical protein
MAWMALMTSLPQVATPISVEEAGVAVSILPLQVDGGEDGVLEVV